MKICTSCGNKEPDENLFCTQCGKKLGAPAKAIKKTPPSDKKICPACKKPNDLSNNFCIYCRHAFKSEGGTTTTSTHITGKAPDDSMKQWFKAPDKDILG